MNTKDTTPIKEEEKNKGKIPLVIHTSERDFDIFIDSINDDMKDTLKIAQVRDETLREVESMIIANIAQMGKNHTLSIESLRAIVTILEEVSRNANDISREFVRAGTCVRLLENVKTDFAQNALGKKPKKN